MRIGLVVLVLLALAPATLAQDTCTPDGSFLLAGYDLSGEQAPFLDAAAALVGAELVLPAEIDAEGFTALEAVATTLYAVNMDELAFTYPEAKVDASLAAWGGVVPADLSATQRAELAAAVDTGLLNCTDVALDEAATADFAAYLMERALVFTGAAPDYLGYASDPDIYNRVLYIYGSFDQVFMPELQESSNELIRQGVITGYNIKRASNAPNFNPETTIVYGHSNISHALQLIGLLRSEGLDARVMLEPKTSAFLYLAEWGEPSTSPAFQAEPLEDGNYIAYAKEFDIAFEFDSAEDKVAFDEVVKLYAKKDADDEPGLILGSWFQPLYSSTVEVADYTEVRNNVAAGDAFYIQSFSLLEDSETIQDRFAEAYPDAEVSQLPLWVNEAFHNYLMGESL